MPIVVAGDALFFAPCRQSKWLCATLHYSPMLGHRPDIEYGLPFLCSAGIYISRATCGDASKVEGGLRYVHLDIRSIPRRKEHQG